MSRNAFAACEREYNEAEERNEIARMERDRIRDEAAEREINDAPEYLDAMATVDMNRPRVVSKAGQSCNQWAPVIAGAKS